MRRCYEIFKGKIPSLIIEIFCNIMFGSGGISP